MEHSPRRPLEGRVALVSGATQGIGLSIVERLVSDGAVVAINGRSADARMAAAVAATGAHPAPADVSDRDAVQALVHDIEQTIGTIDVLVANHAYMSMSPLVDYDLDDWWRVVDTNLGGTFHLIQAVLPGMRRQGAGRIVVISSEWGVIRLAHPPRHTPPRRPDSIALTKTLGRELAPEGIVVNAVAPGVIDTPQLLVDARSGQGLAWTRSASAMPGTCRWDGSAGPRRSPRWSPCSPTSGSGPWLARSSRSTAAPPAPRV